MGIVSKALSIVADRRLRDFERATADPVTSQRQVFHQLMRRGAATEWGRKYGFAEVQTPETFRQRVPITDYETMAPIWHRAFEGARDVTWPGHVRFFALSSGTTSGDKLLPVTREAIRSNRRAGTDLVSFLVKRGGAQAVASGKFFYLGGTTNLRERGKSLFGDASGIMGRHIPFYARRRYLPDRQIGGISNWEEKIERIVERYLISDVCALSACPSWAALLFKEMQKATDRQGEGRKPVGTLWPNFSFFVSYGMAFDPYRKAFEEYIGRPIHYVDTYSSSEAGMTAIQEEDGGPLRLIVDNGVFFEFIPAEKGGEADPPRLHLGEVEVGKDYAVLMSSNGGFWAYPLGDVIRFESLRPPRIAFSGRTQIFLSAFGEHVTLEMIEDAMAGACEETGARVADFTVWPRYPSPGEPKPAHRWIVEFERKPDDADRFMTLL
ncbi:MAG: GH3 family acyl-acid amido synthetase, partial [Planctomycetota bacterium]